MNNRNRNDHTIHVSSHRPLVDTKRSIEKFVQNTKKKVLEKKFETKEELLEEIKDFNDNLKLQHRDDTITMEQFSKEVEELLKEFDKNKQIPTDSGYDNLTEHTLSDGRVLANLVKGNGTNITLEQTHPNQTIKDEMDELYNKSAASHLDEIKQDSVESNYELLQETEKVETYFQEINALNNQVNNPFLEEVSPTIDALHHYADQNRILMEYTADGLGRDEYGNIYEANMDTHGNTYIKKTEKRTFDSPESSYEPRQTLDTVSPGEMEEDLMQMQEDEFVNSQYVQYLLDRSKSATENEYTNAYRDILQESGLPEEQIAMYENAVEVAMMSNQGKEMEDERMKVTEESFVKENKPKQFVLKKENDSRGGFVNAFLLTIVTVLFGTLCTAYMFIGILG